MECLKCRKKKLSKEFPSFTLNEDCDHAPLHCLRCVTAHAESFAKETKRKCSFTSCDKEIDESKLRMCYIELDALFPEVHPSSSVTIPDAAHLIIKRLDGVTINIPYQHALLTVHQVKCEIEKQMKLDIKKQCLVFKGQEIKDSLQGKPNILSECGVRPGDTIFLMILLYAIPPNLTKVVFELFFGWPDAGKDYLDASALIFSNKEYQGVADYKSLGFAGKAVYHSGDRQDRVRKEGKHRIKVDLSILPEEITHIFFTLSSYKSPDISHFKKPTLRFFDESKPDKMLCPDQIKKAGKSQAIVMCSLTKMFDQWYVHDNGATSKGNVKDYEPLKTTIIAIMDSTV
ncbi:uncharacterized protein [Amphiura filiformis]|uniref:uncharacterized protein n=1 Tax=Amphiura filiformis TaxID=82378 RepID=UPI003B21B1C6